MSKATTELCVRVDKRGVSRIAKKYQRTGDWVLCLMEMHGFILNFPPLDLAFACDTFNAVQLSAEDEDCETRL